MYLLNSPVFIAHLIDSYIIKNGGNYSEWEIGITDNPEELLSREDVSAKSLKLPTNLLHFLQLNLWNYRNVNKDFSGRGKGKFVFVRKI